MKKFCLILSVVLLVFTACQQTPKPVKVDTVAERAAIKDLLDKVTMAMKAQDVTTLLSFFTDGTVCLGSDPSELWDKQQLKDLWTIILVDTAPEHNFISKRVIKVTSDGKTAVAVYQYFMPMFTPKIPFRNVYYLVKTGDKWMIDFFSTALIPKNEDIPKLTDALK